jgi:hypothetical protein
MLVRTGDAAPFTGTPTAPPTFQTIFEPVHMRLTPNQKIIMDYIQTMGGRHVYIGITLKADCFSGWEWHEIERPLAGLVKRGLLTVVNKNFYYVHPTA